MARLKNSLSTEQMEAIARAVADPRRFAILECIAANDSTPCSVVREANPISPATISHHMKELEAAGLVAMEREGRTVQLRFQRDTWKAYLAQLAEL